MEVQDLPAVLMPLLRVGGRLLNQALTSERRTRVSQPVPPQPAVAAGPRVQPWLLGPVRDEMGSAENGALGRLLPPAGMDAAQR